MSKSQGVSRWVYTHIHPEVNRRISLEEATSALALLVGRQEILQAAEVMSTQQMYKTPIAVYAFEITALGYYELVHGIIGRGPFADWIGQVPSLGAQPLENAQPSKLEELVGWELRRIPHDLPIKDYRERRVTFHVDEHNVIKSYSFG